MSNNASSYLNLLWKRGQDFLGVEIPILGGAMTWVSDHSLVSAISNAQGFGILACGAMTPDLLKNEIRKTQEYTKKPFGVNLITLHPMLSELIDVCVEFSISHVFLAGGLPPKEAIEKLKQAEGDGFLMAQSPNAIRRVQLPALDASLDQLGSSDVDRAAYLEETRQVLRYGSIPCSLVCLLGHLLDVVVEPKVALDTLVSQLAFKKLSGREESFAQ